MAAARRPAWLAAFARLFEQGRPARGLLAWLIAALGAVLVGATSTIVFLLIREIVLNPPFPPSEWWVFLHLWRPLLIAGAILVPLFSGPLAALSVWIIRRSGWRRPVADMIAGATCGLGALVVILLVARNFGPMGDGP